MSFETISVIGLGYVGLPTAAAFAARKKRVIGVDINKSTVATINEGHIHIIEPELDMMVRAAVSQGYLSASTQVLPADVFLIAVPTPFKGDHEPDLSHIEAAAKSIAPTLKKGNLVILESTSPVGTTEKLADWLADERPDLSFPQQVGENANINISHCPERVMPGHVMRELVQNDRIIGGMTNKCAKRSAELYKTFVHAECTITNARTAEMAKLTENSFRDVNIAFANELSIICEKLNINVWELIDLANRHPRVNILQPGPGVGGHCIAVDPWFIVDSAPQEAKLIHTARNVNDGKPKWVVKKVKEASKDIENPVIACLGLSFKANIDDCRESPAIEIIERLSEETTGKILVVEPNIELLPDRLDKKVCKNSLSDALAQANIVLILVDHSQFKQVAPETIREKTIIDTRGIWN